MTNFNRYAYGANNPYKFTDPDGRSIALAVPFAEGGTFVCGPPCTVVGGIIGAGIGLWIGDKIVDHMQKSEADTPVPTGAPGDKAPALPTGLVGEKPRDTGKYGGTAKGTSLPADKFPQTVNDLTGGTLGTPDARGRSTSPNGVSVRTGGKDGPRIEVPANGTKPVEIIHFPENTPVPDNLKPRP